MDQTEEAIRLVCTHEEIAFDEELLRMPQFVCTTFSIIITLGRSCRLENSVTVEAEIQALIIANSFDKDIIIYTDGSVIRHVRGACYFTDSVESRTVYEDRSAFASTTSSMTMYVTAVTRSFTWLEAHS
jgi:hypothetical protein